jgi:hypothetical protein
MKRGNDLLGQALRRLTASLGWHDGSRLSTGLGVAISVLGVWTGMAFGFSGLLFTSVLLVMALFVVAAITSPRRPGDGDGVPAGLARGDRNAADTLADTHGGNDD